MMGVAAFSAIVILENFYPIFKNQELCFRCLLFLMMIFSKAIL